MPLLPQRAAAKMSAPAASAESRPVEALTHPPMPSGRPTKFVVSMAVSVSKTVVTSVCLPAALTALVRVVVLARALLSVTLLV